MDETDQPLEAMLADAPKNWGRWGDDDEIGALNLLGPTEVVRAARLVRTGQVLPLGLGIGDARGEPILPGRAPSLRLNTQDRGHYLAGKARPLAGGFEYADDFLMMCPQGSTQVDALAHAWYGDQVWNGYPAASTVGSLQKASVAAIAAHGLVGRGVLLDIARHRGVGNLDRDEVFTVEELDAVAAAQGVELRPGDMLLVRTGWLGVYYREGPEAFYGDRFTEPGMLATPAVPEWFRAQDIVAYGTDTITNELGTGPYAGTGLHAALMRNLGVVFVEMLALDELAEACAADGVWDFLFVCSPLRLHGATGSPVNPLALR